MSNKIFIIFGIIWILPTFLFSKPISKQDSLFSQAKEFFDYEKYEEATAIYQGLYNEGIYQEDMLYRLAFMYEQRTNYPESIYYLRKIQWELGGNHLEEKIHQLVDRISLERLSAGEGWSKYRLFIKRNFYFLLGSLGCLVFFAAIFILPKWSNLIRTSGAFFAGLAILLGVSLIDHQMLSTPKGVVMRPTAYYELPSYGAPNRALPIPPGATVNILSKNDIWYEISMENFRCWVPQFVIRKI